jgi:hypothetical protein
MSNKKTAIIILILIIITIPIAYATPSGGTIPPKFTHKSDVWYDAWGITRTNAEGSHVYLPLMLSETIGKNSERAYQIGETFKDTYSDRNTMAAKILKYVQTWVDYGYDEDNVFMNGVAQQEWAWNADELAHSFDETNGQVAVGDCEDIAFLCATIYRGAGIDVALVDAPGHVAVLIWLPDYSNANQYWDLSEDDQGAGWIWVEATGSSNPLGWTPPDFSDGQWTAYTYVNNEYIQQQPIETSADGTGTGGTGTDEFSSWDIVFLIVVVLFIFFTRSKR